MRLTFIGAGRLATQLARALHEEGGHEITAVWSRTMASARELAVKVGAVAAAGEPFTLPSADAVIIAVKDDALPQMASQLSVLMTDGTIAPCPVFHTAGSVDMGVLSALPRHGVLYPMQSFSKERRADFSVIPFFIEASDDDTLAVARSIASSVSSSVTVLDSVRRRQLHLAAVFANNFANHCYVLAADILERNGLDFSLLLPLVGETAAKVATMPPRDAQTGPAVRYDRSVLDRQRRLLSDSPLTQQLYDLMSESIHSHSSQ